MFEKRLLYSCKVVVFGKRWLYSASGSIRIKVVVFGQRWLYSDKSGCNRQNGCIRAKVFVFRKSGCIPEKVVVFLQSGCNRTKVVLLTRKWL